MIERRRTRAVEAPRRSVVDRAFGDGLVRLKGTVGGSAPTQRLGTRWNLQGMFRTRAENGALRDVVRLSIVKVPAAGYGAGMTLLTDEQRQQARQWIEDGMKLSDFQKRVESEYGLKLTYMETRFLVDDLKVVPKDPEPAPVPPPPPADAVPAEPLVPGKLSVSVDAVTAPGMAVSGKVTFSDGQKAKWYVDQYGRPGLIAEDKGYRPSREDLQEFQLALDKELTRMGM